MGAENSYGEIAPDIDNPFGCIPCFCFGHSNTCSPASHMVKGMFSEFIDHPSYYFKYRHSGFKGSSTSTFLVLKSNTNL